MTREELTLFCKRKMFDNYTVKNLTNINEVDFKRYILGLEGVVDYDSERYAAYEREAQRDLSVKFHWGHDHDFGTFQMAGRMKSRHVDVFVNFCKHFNITPEHFKGKAVLDIGSWTGGTALLLGAMEAQVLSIEEVAKYAQTSKYLVEAFGRQEQISVENRSLYACDDDAFYDRFDIAYFPGVLYHLSDPVLALRILYNTLKLGGEIYIESAGIDMAGPFCKYEGSQTYHTGNKEALNRGGWNWYLPTAEALELMLHAAGFDAISTHYDQRVKRLYGHAKKVKIVGITKAGLSRPDIR